MGKPDTAYNKEIKLAREKKKEINCGRCRYHKVENAIKQQRPDKYKSKRRG